MHTCVFTYDVNSKNALNLNCYYYLYSVSQIIMNHLLMISACRRALQAKIAAFPETGYIDNTESSELKLFLTNVPLMHSERTSESYLLTLHRALENSYHTTPGLY